MKRPSQLELFKAALQRQAALPVFGAVAAPMATGHASAYFPIAGLCLGVPASLLYHSLSRIFSEDLACLAVIGLLFLVAGKNRAAGLLAYFQTCSPGASAPRRKSVSDPFALSCLAFLMLLKYLGLTHVGEGWIHPMLILLPAIGGWTVLCFSFSLSSRVSPGCTHSISFARHVGEREFWAGTGVTTLAAYAFLGLMGIFLLLAVFLWMTLMERAVLEREESTWGDFLEAETEISQVLFMLTAIAARKALSAGIGEGIMA